MSNVEVIRDLTESLIAQFIENDSLQKYQNVTKASCGHTCDMSFGQIETKMFSIRLKWREQ